MALNNTNVDPDWLSALAIIKTQADNLVIPFMVIGASARDIILDAWNISPIRATRDVDLAIEIASWERFDELKEALIRAGSFQPDGMMQRLLFEERLPIDLVPYGALEEADSEISWPPDHSVHMSVVGMNDVFESSLSLPLTEASDAPEIKVASATGIVILKILAWEDRKLRTPKDAEDLYFVLRHYIDLGNQNHLEANNSDLYDDFEIAHARLLGRDILSISSVETLLALNTILQREIDDAAESMLIRHMLPRHAGSDQSELCLRLLIAMKIEMH